MEEKGECTVVRYDQKEIFLKAVKELLYEREVQNNVIIGFLGYYSSEEIVMLAVLDGEGRVVDCGLMTQRGRERSHCLLIADKASGGEKAVGVYKMFQYILQNNIHLLMREVAGFEKDVVYFIELWNNHFSEKELHFIKERVDRVFQLDTVNPNTLNNLKGKMILATMEHLDTALQFFNFFSEEVDGKIPDEGDTKKHLTNLIQNNFVYFYQVQLQNESQLVSMAVNRRETENVGCISTVVTPKHFQNNGYATQLVALLSKTILEDKQKKRVALFADTQNPHSTYIYQKIGFHPLEDWLCCRIPQFF
eukprot:TRINITY_DN27244_c0_g1_i1.p1 TRINITY_DN27244_c0_g1~~TRINITY_DN27244_c0_g1_i1.p1  ORF type:complete len:307 (+),score=86.62 TRINITY_DN27244_c0_g1_i1:71-991(+)